MANVMEARLVISAKDETGAGIEGIKKHIAALDASIASLDKMMAATAKVAKATDPMAASIGQAQRAINDQREALAKLTAGLDRIAGPAGAAAAAEARLRAEIERTTGALVAREGAVKRQGHAAAGKSSMMGEIVPWVGPVLLGGAKKMAMSGAELQHSNNQLAKLSLSPDDISAINDRALALSTKYGNVTQTAGVDMFKELRSVVTTPSEALQVLDPMMAAASVLNASDPSGEMSKNLTDLVKGAENLGAAKDPARLVRLIDGWTKAMQVMGHTINPEGVYEFAKYTRAAGASLSDRFLMTTGMSLSQEMGGSSAGNSMAMLYSQLAGGFQNSHGALKEFVRLGLIGANEVDYLKNGEAKQLKSGVKPKWLNQADHDPDYFLWNTILPAMAKHGISRPEDVLPEIRRLFPNRSESDAMTKLFVQREQYAAHAAMYESATGLAGAKLNADDPLTGLSSLGAQLETFAGVLTSPIMKDAGNALTAMASEIGEWSKGLAAFQKEHPTAAKGVAGGVLGAAAGVGAWLTTKLLTGIGGRLFGSAAGAAAAGAASSSSALGALGRLAGVVAGAETAGIGLAVLDLANEPHNLRQPLSKFSLDTGWATEREDMERATRAQALLMQGSNMEAARGAAYHRLEANDGPQVRLDPDSKAVILVRVEAASELLRAIASVQGSGGNLEAIVGRMDGAAAPARGGGIGHM